MRDDDMSERIPSDWQPDRAVYDKADAAGMDVKWVKEQLARFIENTEDTGQSLNRHFDNYLHRCHKPGKQSTSRPQPSEWVTPEIDKTDQKTADTHLAKIRESL